jgi:hypothetical protein
MLRKIARTERERKELEVGETLHNCGLHDVYPWPNDTVGIQTRKIVQMRQGGKHRRELKFVEDLVGNRKEEARFVDLGVNGKITFKGGVGVVD